MGSNPFPHAVREYDLYEELGMDLCPVCGQVVHITGRTQDGRLIGSCGDAFTDEQWNEDDELQYEGP